MQCRVLCAVLVILHTVQGDNRTSDSAEVTETQLASCQIVTDKLVATATATVSRALKGVCSARELDKHFQNIRLELNDQINKIHAILLKTNLKLAELHELLEGKVQQQNSPTNNGSKIKPRDFEIKEYNFTVHEDDVTKKKVFSYYWKIDGIKDKTIINNKQIVLHSPRFYVNEGYRMYIKMFPHQDKGNVYIHVGLTHGEHDGRLDWPFRLKHRVTVVDQSPAAEDITSQLWDPAVLCSVSDWQRPSATKDAEECVGFGFTQDTLFHNSYILDDSLVIKLDVFI